ncbi:MAG: nucleotidyltransferase domain-containing protein [Vallitaleaceae bacterium]|nr:nucleotidyltransferase domain-containing protein [Vallitaleaceae bacterium]
MKRFTAISNHLKKEYHAQKVILYGSYARGDMTPESDVDLLVIAPTHERFFERMATVRRLLRDFRRGLAIAPLVFTEEEINQRKEKGDQFIAEILEKGVEI